MKWLDAIEHVLREADERLHYGELAKRIMSRQLVPTKPRTPDITVHASVTQDIHRRQERGLPPRLLLEGGEIWLAEWTAPTLRDALETVQQLRTTAKRELLTQLRRLDGQKFESYLEVLLISMGYEVQVIGGGDDDGIDLIAESSTGVSARRIGVQAKCIGSSRRVGPNVVRVLRDALQSKGCQSGTIMSTARFDDRAVEVAAEAGRPAIELIGPDELAELAAEHSVGISGRQVDPPFGDLDAVFARST